MKTDSSCGWPVIEYYYCEHSIVGYGEIVYMSKYSIKYNSIFGKILQ